MENEAFSSTDRVGGCANFGVPFNQIRKQNTIFQHGDVELSP